MVFEACTRGYHEEEARGLPQGNSKESDVIILFFLVKNAKVYLWDRFKTDLSFKQSIFKSKTEVIWSELSLV